jgi:phytoene synthase
MATHAQQGIAPLAPEQLDHQCREAMRQGSLSFFLASRLLPADQRLAVFRLYAWCRHCDDVIDEASRDRSSVELERRLAALKEATAACYQGPLPEEPVFRAFALVVREYQIPQEYPMELLEGMAMDCQGYHYRTEDDLELYCYRVAGTVGLMSCHVFGIRDERALAFADSMGRAMQLTNIARDLVDDAAMNRVYVPDSWFPNGPVAANELCQPENRHLLVPLAARLVQRADAYYKQGEQGLIDLPWQCALAVTAARHIYAEIGYWVVARGERAWDSRTWVPTNRKFALVMKAIWQSLLQVPRRVQRPWRSIEISAVRRPFPCQR